MSIKEKITGILITIFFSVFALIPIFEDGITAKEHPEQLYRVYLDGKGIGIIRSRSALEDFINNEQKELKEKYNVDSVYLPQGLYIRKYMGYSKNILTENEIYNRIKDEKPFTIKGYIVTIHKEEPITINVLNKDYFETSVNNTIKAFVPEETLNKFLEDEIEEITTTGRRLEDLYVEEEITIREALIPSDEKIFVDDIELTRYLLFGNLEEPDEYIVKPGDTIETIAFDNSLGVEEFLVVNPNLNNQNSLLYVGQRVKIGLISPIISVIEEEHVIEDKEVKYKTEIKYDDTKQFGYMSVAQEGSNGLQRVTQKLKYENGQIITAIVTNYENLRPVINRVEVRGTFSPTGPTIVGDENIWAWPTNTPYIITSHFGYRWGTLHDGVDIAGTGHGSPIYAANGGTVHQSAFVSLGGNQVIINHNNGFYTVYAHLSKRYVAVGQQVQRGQVIGLMGNTGWSTGTHLHFGAFRGIPYHGGVPFNPLTLYR